ncbi:response regulator [Echinicola marina]|uniref:hybrid sensor histidine kinase/response regulator transcription factor n=1 Tax=Echinicola marina TaxID=2859768 RepID=UPI001CF67C9D|nr:two-component regulator propeller domain-containing protein [Echinicola marina]UCS92131.1 response regulator [Echinicola marina]
MSRISIFSLIFQLLLVFFIAEKGHAQYRPLKFEQLDVNDGLPQNAVYAITKDKYGYIWLGTWGGAVRYDGYDIKVFRANGNDSTALRDNRISAIATDALGKVWIQVEPKTTIYQYNYEKENFKAFPIEQAPDLIQQKIRARYSYHTKYEENEEYKWQTSSNGLIQVHKQHNDTLIYHPDPMDPQSLSDEITKYLYLDDQEHLWIGTQSGGLNHTDLNTKPFINYHKGQAGQGLLDNVVRAICTDQQGRIWVGSENLGITLIDNVSSKPTYTYIGQNKLNDLQIRTLFCDSKGLVWIGTKNGLVYYDPQKDTFFHASKTDCSIGVFAIEEDQNGHIWVGSFYGLSRYDKENDRFHCYDSSLGLAGKQIMDLMIDQENNLWIATEEGGMSRMALGTGSIEDKEFDITNYTHTEQVQAGPLSNRTYSLTEDHEGRIWLATDAGISVLDPNSKQFQHFTRQNGLTDELILALAFDAKEAVWASHTKGLSKINTTTGEIQNFNLFDGLQGNEFKQSAVFRDSKSSKLFFGGSNGLTSFVPEQIKTNPFAPKVILTNLNVMHEDVHPGTKINDRAILENALLTTDEITLTWWDKTFRLEFAALHYANPLSNKYKYKLEGFDSDWIYTDASRRMASYSNLPAGNYVFKVFGANSDGVWSDIPASLRIKVLPPWWLSWWAITIYVLVLLLMGWFIFRYLNAKILHRKSEAIHQAKLHFFTEISHEFRTPLTLIIDPLERLLKERPKKQIAEQYYQLMHSNAKQLLILINQLLDFRKLESGHLKLALQQADIIAFVRGLGSSFEEMAKRRGIDFRIITSAEQFIMDFDTDKLTMILNNLLSNAFKFTPDQGQIILKVAPTSLPKEGITILVQDNGQGIPKEDQEKIFGIFYQSAHNKKQHKGSGIGLSLSKELVELHDGKIEVESTVGKGTSFSVFLPRQLDASEFSQITDQESSLVGPPTTVLDTDPNLPEAADAETPLILVVDDHTDIRTYVEMSFNKEYRILTATNGLEGLALAIDHIPDLIISDVMMPDMNGLQLCKQLKTDERTSHIPIILLTARQSPESKTEGYETGADAYVTKPFNTTVLRAQVKNLMEQRRRLRELFSKGTSIELKKIAINSADEKFLQKTRDMIESNLETENLDIDSLAAQLNMSRPQFYRKIKALTNKSAADFVTTFRMNKAAEYLLSRDHNITETAYKVGYTVPNNFSRAFSKHFGCSPSQYIKESKNRNN